MKFKNLLFLLLIVFSFIGTVGIGKTSAIPLPHHHADRVNQEVQDLRSNTTNGGDGALRCANTPYKSRLCVSPDVVTLANRKEEQAQLTDATSTQNLEQKAEELYETGRFKDAILLLNQLKDDYAARADKLGQARVLRNLALVYQKTGEWKAANEAVANSINYLQGKSDTQEGQQLLAQALEVQGLLQLSVGQAEPALESWKQAAINYQRAGDETGVFKSQINQAQALQKLGLYREAIKLLNQVNAAFQAQPDNLLKVKELQSLGNALRVVGNLNQSQKVLEQSLAIAQKLSDSESIASSLLSLGNTVKFLQKIPAALEYYQRATETSASPYLQIQARANQMRLLVEQNQWSEALALVPQIESNLSQLPLSRTAINARINLTRSLMKIVDAKEQFPSQLPIPKTSEIAQLLATAVQQAQTLEDQRALTYALGNFGRLYEQNKQWDSAKELTEKALILAQGINASDIAYRWQWQLGRILQVQGNRVGALAAYTSAFNTLQSIRSDLVAISSEAQFSFRESVEPVYRELVSLLLPPGENVEQSALKQAREVIDSLQLAELDNFFQDACLKIQPVPIDQLDPTAAVLSTIILSDRIEVIAALPGQPLRRYTTLLPQKNIETTLVQARRALTIPRLQLSVKNFLVPSQKVYDWLIRPLETELANSGVKTLVFVLDGTLRNIPMAALYDGKAYLVQKYKVVLAPSLQLVDPKPLAREKLKVLTAGLSEARQGFSALPGVVVELEGIEAEVAAAQLLNQSFTTSNFKTKILSAAFPIVHLATHGQFSSQAENTFILTWDDRINAKDLDSLLRADARKNHPIELLVLSACQTAIGDNRATLGLTGIAVRAGARSTLASLWSVNDEATASLMVRFYEELAKSQTEGGNMVTKAEALRHAQQEMLQKNEFSHPYFWAAFVLVGNWL